MKQVTILRGISGSGKSTWAKAKYPGATVVSADDHLVNTEGEVEFSVPRLRTAHELCWQAFHEALHRDEAHIVVDNTNIEAWEIAPYVLPAQAFGYKVEILTLECAADVAIARKDLLTSEKVKRKARLLDEATRHLPFFFKELHRSVKTDEANRC